VTRTVRYGMISGPRPPSRTSRLVAIYIFLSIELVSIYF
jgi:hypothetical protein